MAQHRERFIVTRRVASCAKNVRLLKDRPRRVNRNTSTTPKQPLHCVRHTKLAARSVGVSSCFLHSLIPLPKPGGDVTRQPMAELTRQHDNLSPVMALVRDEIRQDMRHIQRQVAPNVGLRRRHMASGGEPELKECFDASAAPIQSRKQFATRHLAAVNRSRDGDAVFLTQGLEPHTPSIMDMRRDHADCAPR
jgi:hypothetical protein